MRDFLKRIADRLPDGLKNPSKKTGYLVLIGMVGLLLLIVGNVFSSSDGEDQPDKENMRLAEEQDSPAKETSSKDTETNDVAELEKNYENDLKTMLEDIAHVSDVDVMINLDATREKIYEKNLITTSQTTDETDTQGGMRKMEDQSEETDTVIVRQGDGESPIHVQTKKPMVRGVFVVAGGTEDIQVKKWVIEAVSRVLDVETHRVSVMPK